MTQVHLHEPRIDKRAAPGAGGFARAASAKTLRRVLLRQATIGVIITALIPTHLHATSGPGLEIERLTQHAQVIVVGRCTAIRSSWNAPGTQISTYATYDVEDAVKGATPGPHLVVKALGGTVGNISQMVVDGARFDVGARDVLFLVESDEPGALHIFGLGLGQWRVSTHPESGQHVVVGPPGRPASLWGSGTSRAVREQEGPRIPEGPAHPLDAVLETLREYLRKGSAGR
jgi:hypothetical protein